MASQMKVSTSVALGGTKTSVTRTEIEDYLKKLAHLGKTSVNTPYTLNPTTHAALNKSQLATTMRKLGYSPAQIKDAQTGNLPGRPSWLGNFFQGIAGGVAALGPEASAPLGVVGDFLGAGSAVSDLPGSQGLQEYAPEEEIRAEEAAAKAKEEDATKPKDATPEDTTPSGAKVWDTGSNAALMTIWGDLTGDIKYAAVWVGLMILGLMLILSGLRTTGVKGPSIPIVVAP